MRSHRFVAFVPSTLVPLGGYLHACLGTWTGVSFVDSTKRAVCHNRRIKQHRVFNGLATRGKTSVGWFCGFKVPLVFNDCGELLRFKRTPGTGDDRVPVPQFATQLFGKRFGDTGYLSEPLHLQRQRVFGVALITPRRKNMPHVALPLLDNIRLRKRAMVETSIDQLKHIAQIEHPRHRSPINCVVNLLCGLIAYAHRPQKPSLQRDKLPSTLLA